MITHYYSRQDEEHNKEVENGKPPVASSCSPKYFAHTKGPTHEGNRVEYYDRRYVEY